MWRLVRNPNNKYCLGLDEESVRDTMIPIEMRELYPRVNTIPFRVLSAFEVAAAIVYGNALLLLNITPSFVTIIAIDCGGQARVALTLHSIFMLVFIPLFVLERAYVTLSLIALRLIMYTVILMSMPD
jgi:hypothetical protein